MIVILLLKLGMEIFGLLLPDDVVEVGEDVEDDDELVFAKDPPLMVKLLDFGGGA